MSGLKNIFQRKETKYIMDSQTYDQLKEALSHYMSEDEFGLHTIISVYYDYDTENYELIQRSIDKPTYREKFRIRSYGVPTDHSVVYMEIKKKVKGIVYKRRVSVDYLTAKTINHQQTLAISNDMNKQSQQIQSEINWLLKREKLMPKVMIAYDRIALKQENVMSDFRITFDFNIRYRTNHLDVSYGDTGALVAPEIDVLMEVKALGAYPLWFSEMLSEFHLYKATFSKYAQTYQRYLIKEEIKNVI